MKKSIFFIFTFLLIQSTLFFAQSKISANILANGKWYNDEYSFTFAKNKTYKAFFTLGKTNGTMNGKYEINDKENIITIEKGKLDGAFGPLLATTDKIVLKFYEDKSNPKSSKFLKDNDENIALWNDKSFVPPNTEIFINVGNEKIKCLALGYQLNSTTTNVRIRKGPGTNYDYMQFTYKDLKTNSVKSFGSVLEGTNIRVLAKTVDKFKVNEWFNNWYFIEYKEPQNDFLVYKTAWMYGEFINVPENKDRQINIEYPENESGIYGVYDLEIGGNVTGAPVSVKIQVKNSYGNILYEEKVTSYEQQSGKFFSKVSKENDTLFIGSNIFNIVAVYSDNKTASKQITVYIHESMGEMAKPVIYLYPEKEMQVSVKVFPKNGFSETIPPYNKGWEVIATPSGTITNKPDGQKYPYLFWESKDYTGTDLKTGFVVKTSELKTFFQEKLTYLGMNENELSDFLEFWLPIMKKGEYYFVSFYDKKTLDKEAPLEINPKPDTVIRIFFDSKPLDKPIQVVEQKLTQVKRKGFTVVEWGGMRYK
ncbi:MAG TPA: hypothetical protein PK771_10950 [Spirochaetota bacterium]|nr:hypothetical protein [Spirochaetota bacterium]